MPAPSLNRGILILLAPNAKDANISQTNSYFVFQYNPEKLIHTFNQGLPIALSEHSEATSCPVELFNLTFDLDSLDLEPLDQNQISTDLGIHPALAILESMMQPQTISGQKVLPIVVLRWGANRSVPVRIVSMNVEEKTFDQKLNPTRATVELTLRVLSASEVVNSSGARSVYANHQSVQVALADKYRIQTGQGSFAGTVSGAGITSITASSAPLRSLVAEKSAVTKNKANAKKATNTQKARS